MAWNFDNSYGRLPERFYSKAKPTPVAKPQLVIFNQDLADSLGLNVPQDAALFAGNTLPDGVEPLAQVYAGHQFGYLNALGDGRAHLLGEHVTPDGKRYDIQLKGSGPTPYSRQGDGRAALGPMLREYIISEAMHGLGIPTTRSLAVVTTGEQIQRDTPLPGAILTRVAASHIRVGTFESLAAQTDLEGLKLLADYAIKRHYPEVASAPQPYLAFLQAVMERQAALIAQWLNVGFIHGVMNTDNMAISGETIDYGPCAFMNAYNPATVFSSIDSRGRYAFGKQPHIAQWNLARLGEAILPLLDDDIDTAVRLAETEIEKFGATFQSHWLAVMRKKIGLFGEEEGDLALFQALLDWMHRTRADYTLTFRALSPDNLLQDPMFQHRDFITWHAQWLARLARNPKPFKSSQCLMNATNPALIPRNHLVEAALKDAGDGNMKTMLRLLDALKTPFDDLPAFTDMQQLPPASDAGYKTFCGT